MMLQEKINNTIRDVPDFPKEGILFKDITPLFQDQPLCTEITENFVQQFQGTPIDAVVGIESRGFLFGFSLANKLGVPFVLVRKEGKLPYRKTAYKYDLEYGSAVVELQEGDVKPGWNVLIHDDLLATGGTAIAAAELVKKQGASVAGFAFVVELDFLKGKEKINTYASKVYSVVNY